MPEETSEVGLGGTISISSRFCCSTATYVVPSSHAGDNNGKRGTFAYVCRGLSPYPMWVWVRNHEVSEPKDCESLMKPGARTAITLFGVGVTLVLAVGYSSGGTLAGNPFATTPSSSVVLAPLPSAVAGGPTGTEDPGAVDSVPGDSTGPKDAGGGDNVCNHAPCGCIIGLNCGPIRPRCVPGVNCP
jgi:hypothetical protein